MAVEGVTKPNENIHLKKKKKEANKTMTFL